MGSLAIHDYIERGAPTAPPRRAYVGGLLAKFFDPGKLDRQQKLQDFALAIGERPEVFSNVVMRFRHRPHFATDAPRRQATFPNARSAD